MIHLPGLGTRQQQIDQRLQQLLASGQSYSTAFQTVRRELALIALVQRQHASQRSRLWRQQHQSDNSASQI